MSPTLDDHEGRMRVVEGIAAESRWDIEALETTMRKTVELLERVERRVEKAEWQHEQSAASVTRRQAIMAACAVAIVSPVVATVLTYLLR